jgi:glycosyltransferase involved in cell wall biosynthesis
MKDTTQPRTVVILGIFNEIDRISRSIQSLKDQNTYFSCVVSDNKSSDGTYEYLTQSLKDDPRFFLIQPTQHIPQINNFKFALDFALVNFNDIKYMMNFAGDDELLNNNYLESLSGWLDSNPSFQAVAPTVVNYNYRHKTSKEVSPKLSSKFSFFRVIKFGTKTSSSGFINIVNGLMRKNSYIDLMELFYSFSGSEANGKSGRNIRAEFIAYMKFSMDNRVGNVRSVKLLKEIHNRSDIDNRIKYLEMSKENISKVANLKHQLHSQLWPYKAFILYHSSLDWKVKINLFIFANLFLVTNMLSIFWNKFRKLLI